MVVNVGRKPAAAGSEVLRTVIRERKLRFGSKDGPRGAIGLQFLLGAGVECALQTRHMMGRTPDDLLRCAPDEFCELAVVGTQEMFWPPANEVRQVVCFTARGKKWADAFLQIKDLDGQVIGIEIQEGACLPARKRDSAWETQVVLFGLPAVLYSPVHLTGAVAIRSWATESGYYGLELELPEESDQPEPEEQREEDQ